MFPMTMKKKEKLELKQTGEGEKHEWCVSVCVCLSINVWLDKTCERKEGRARNLNFGVSLARGRGSRQMNSPFMLTTKELKKQNADHQYVPEFLFSFVNFLLNDLLFYSHLYLFPPLLMPPSIIPFPF